MPPEGPGKRQGSSVIAEEDFPELMNAVAATDWPIFVTREDCVMPSNVGEDFSGAACTGGRIDRLARTDVHCQMPSTVGEDFAGEVCTGTALQLARNAAQDRFEARQHTGVDQDQLAASEGRSKD